MPDEAPLCVGQDGGVPDGRKGASDGAGDASNGTVGFPRRPYLLLYDFPQFFLPFSTSFFDYFCLKNAHYARARVYLYIRSISPNAKKTEKKALKSFAMSPEVRTFALANERNAPPHKQGTAFFAPSGIVL